MNVIIKIKCKKYVKLNYFLIPEQTTIGKRILLQ